MNQLILYIVVLIFTQLFSKLTVIFTFPLRTLKKTRLVDFSVYFLLKNTSSLPACNLFCMWTFFFRDVSSAAVFRRNNTWCIRYMDRKYKYLSRWIQLHSISGLPYTWILHLLVWLYWRNYFKVNCVKFRRIIRDPDYKFEI